MNKLRSLFLALFFMMLIQPLHAHEIRPALLQIVEAEQGFIHVTLKVPALGDRMIGIRPQFPDEFERYGPNSSRLVPGAYIEYQSFKSDQEDALYGKRIDLEGLNHLQIDVLLRIDFKDGTQISSIIYPKEPYFIIPEKGSASQVAASYFNIGVIHILEGYDHLLFVFALLLLISSPWMLFKTITAFTLAHSVTLALSALDVFTLPSAPTEAIISLSIVYLCLEVIHHQQGKESITIKYPWIVAMIFGLFHGLGFAGALSEVGLPQQDIPIALLTFNLGVEAGQILFVLVILALSWLLKKIKIKPPEQFRKIMPYAIGSLAAFWTIERVLSFF